MLFKQFDDVSGKVLKTVRTLLVPATEGYERPIEYGSTWWLTTTTIWNVDELIGRRIRDWRRLLGETGHTGTRTQTMRSDHDSIYTGTHSVFPVPLAEWILLRYGGRSGVVLDAFSGGPPRALVSALMGFTYVGYDIRQEQIDENMVTIDRLGLGSGITYHCGDGTRMAKTEPDSIDFALTCPPYFDLEQYSNLPEDISNLPDYESFNSAMYNCAVAHYRVMKPESYVCIVVGNFRQKRNDGYNELIDFRGDTVNNFRDAGFVFWQDIILSKNFASAAARSTTSWKGQKLVPRHEHLLVFKKPAAIPVKHPKT